MSDWHVVKVGGSLLDWPELPEGLRAWLAEQQDVRIVLIVGGGAIADVIRQADARWNFDPEVSHWLAVDAMGITARLLAALLPEAHYLTTWSDFTSLQATAERNQLVILEVRNFLQNYEHRLPPSALPRDWTVTSDSIAARIAQAIGAARLTLLKSTKPPHGTLSELSAAGYLDEYLPNIAASIRDVAFFNLRQYHAQRIHPARLE